MLNLIEIDNQEYEAENLYKDRIFIADSFVKRSQKTGSGHGEAKLYLGDEGEELRKFFGRDFNLQFFLKKYEVIEFLKSLRVEYFNPTQNYKDKEKLPNLFQERMQEAENLDDLIWFSLKEQTQIEGRRIYAKSSEIGFELIRKFSLPGISYLNIKKLTNCSDPNKKIFHCRLFTDFTPLSGAVFHPHEDSNSEIYREQHIRQEQANFRSRILEQMPFCILTKITDDRLIEAAHIKPYSKCEEAEKYDDMNGLALSYTMHKLFDLGFISFTENQKIMVSDWVQPSDIQKLNITPGKETYIPDFRDRNKYLEFHRKEIFKG